MVIFDHFELWPRRDHGSGEYRVIHFLRIKFTFLTYHKIFMMYIIHDTYNVQSVSLSITFTFSVSYWVYTVSTGTILCSVWILVIWWDLKDFIFLNFFFQMARLLSLSYSTMLVFMSDCSTDNKFFVDKNKSSADSAPDEVVLVEPVPSQNILPMDSWCRSRFACFLAAKYN